MKRKTHNLIKTSNKIPVNKKKLSEKSLRSWDIPEFYKDEIYTCIDCGKETLFSAKEQQQLYEVKQKYFWQRPNRCLLHHDIWRDTRKKKFSMDQKLQELSQKPDNQEVMIDCADAIVLYHKKTNHGNLQLAASLFKKLKTESTHYLYCKEKLNNS